MENTNNTLDFKTYMTAMDYDREYNVLRHTNDWFKLYEIAVEQVEKYGLDGSGIIVGTEVILLRRAEISVNLKRGYRGVWGGGKGIFNGPVEGDCSDRYYSIGDSVGEQWFWKASWWRSFIVVE